MTISSYGYEMNIFVYGALCLVATLSILRVMRHRLRRFVEEAAWLLFMFIIPVSLFAHGLWPIGIVVIVAFFFHIAFDLLAKAPER